MASVWGVVLVFIRLLPAYAKRLLLRNLRVAILGTNPVAERSISMSLAHHLKSCKAGRAVFQPMFFLNSACGECIIT